MSMVTLVVIVVMPVAHSVMLLLPVCLRVKIVEVDLVHLIGEDGLVPLLDKYLFGSLKMGRSMKEGSYAGGSMDASFSATAGSKAGGKTTLNWMMSLPFSKGFLYWGMPSPRTIFKSPVLITSPLTV